MLTSNFENPPSDEFRFNPGRLPRAAEISVLLVGHNNFSPGDLGEFLEGHGFRVLEASDRAAVASVLQNRSVDVIILNDPSFYDGLGLCRELAARGNIPIVMLANCADVTDRIIALEVGADEVLARPCDTRELLARVRSLLRRTGTPVPSLKQRVTDFAGWRLHEEMRVLRSPTGLRMQLAASEYALLKVFLNAPKTIVDVSVASAALGVDPESYQTNFRTSVCRLRRKLNKDRAGPDLLRTVYGRGYVLQADDVLPA